MTDPEANVELVAKLAGSEASRLLLDNRIGIEFQRDQQRTTLFIESTVQFHDGSSRYEICPDNPVQYGPLASLLKRRVRSARVTESGSLRVEMHPEGSILIEPDDNYEAWELIQANGARCICIPGGGLAIWDASGRAGDDQL